MNSACQGSTIESTSDVCPDNLGFTMPSVWSNGLVPSSVRQHLITHNHEPITKRFKDAYMRLHNLNNTLPSRNIFIDAKYINGFHCYECYTQKVNIDVFPYPFWQFKWVQKHGVPLTNALWSKPCKKGVDLTSNILISSGHNFAHVTTAQFSWHMQINWIIRIKTKAKWVSTKC